MSRFSLRRTSPEPTALPPAGSPPRRPLPELLVPDEDAWDAIVSTAADRRHPVTLLDAESALGAATLLALQVTTRSALGALAYHAGGVLVDHGWLRLLGAGHPTIGGGLREWNRQLGGAPLSPPLDGALIVAYDVLGGVFAINESAFAGPPGAIHYFAPDRLQWESLDMGHGAFVQWAMTGDLDRYYAGQRWTGWEDDVAAVGPDEALSIYPPLGFESADGTPVPMDGRSKRPVPMRELWSSLNDLRTQAPTDGRARFTVTD